MVVDDFNFGRAGAALGPFATDPPLVVDADAPLSPTPPIERLQTIAGTRQIAQARGGIELVELAGSAAGKAGEGPNPAAPVECLGFPVSKADDHDKCSRCNRSARTFSGGIRITSSITQRASPRLSFHGITDPAALARRVPTVSFTLAGRDPARIARLLGRANIFVWYGHNYAVEPIAALGLSDSGGVVRVGIAHYNTAQEIDACLDVCARCTLFECVPAYESGQEVLRRGDHESMNHQTVCKLLTLLLAANCFGAARGAEAALQAPIDQAQPSGPFGLSYQILGTPALGQPLEVRVSVVAPQPLSYLSMEAYAHDGLIVTPLSFSVAEPPVDEPVEQTLIVTPWMEGSLRLAVLVTGDAYGATRDGQITIPIQLGEPGPDPAITERLSITPEGETIISLPATEN